jgi:hypothetical protein
MISCPGAQRNSTWTLCQTNVGPSCDSVGNDSTPPKTDRGSNELFEGQLQSGQLRHVLLPQLNFTVQGLFSVFAKNFLSDDDREELNCIRYSPPRLQATSTSQYNGFPRWLTRPRRLQFWRWIWRSRRFAFTSLVKFRELLLTKIFTQAPEEDSAQMDHQQK